VGQGGGYLISQRASVTTHFSGVRIDLEGQQDRVDDNET
jgi:hypothetical protein